MSDKNDFSDEQLVAYVDGELEPAETELIRSAAFIDKALAKRISNYEETRVILQGYFGAESQKKTPEHIASKIRNLEVGTDFENQKNVVPLSKFRAKINKTYSLLSASHGLQKIAASLVVGTFIGTVGMQLVEPAPDKSDKIQIRGYLPSQAVSDSNTCREEDPKNCVPVIFNLFGTKAGTSSVASGTTIQKNIKYRVVIKVKEAGNIALEYQEGLGRPEEILTSQKVKKGQRITFPSNKRKQFQIQTDQEFVTFIVSWKDDSQKYIRHYRYRTKD